MHEAFCMLDEARQHYWDSWAVSASLAKVQPILAGSGVRLPLLEYHHAQRFAYQEGKIMSRPIEREPGRTPTGSVQYIGGYIGPMDEKELEKEDPSQPMIPMGLEILEPVNKLVATQIVGDEGISHRSSQVAATAVRLWSRVFSTAVPAEVFRLILEDFGQQAGSQLRQSALSGP